MLQLNSAVLCNSVNDTVWHLQKFHRIKRGLQKHIPTPVCTLVSSAAGNKESKLLTPKLLTRPDVPDVRSAKPAVQVTCTIQGVGRWGNNPDFGFGLVPVYPMVSYSSCIQIDSLCLRVVCNEGWYHSGSNMYNSGTQIAPNAAQLHIHSRTSWQTLKFRR